MLLLPCRPQPTRPYDYEDRQQAADAVLRQKDPWVNGTFTSDKDSAKAHMMCVTMSRYIARAS
jgi:hypothetical protein